MAQHDVSREPRDPTTGRWTRWSGVIPPKTQAVLDDIRAAGGRPFLVGGAARDALLGHDPKDLDCEVFHLAVPDLLAVLSRHGNVDAVGASFGVYKLRLSDGTDLDVALPRSEEKTEAGHRGFDVTTDPHLPYNKAAARRDFTVNALMVDPHTHEVHDYHGGLTDLATKRLRHVGPAFSEDPLRVLRAMQFAGRFGLDLDGETADLARHLMSEYPTIAPERIWGEWEKVCKKSIRPSAALETLAQSGWLDFYPELAALRGVPQEPIHHPEGDVFTHTKHVCDIAARIAERDGLNGEQRTILLLAAICHDFGKALPGITHIQEDKHGVPRIVSPGHAEAGVDPAASFLTRIGCPLSLRQPVLTLVKEHMAHVGIHEPNHRVVRRLAKRLAPLTVREWARVVEADASGRPPHPPVAPADTWSKLAVELGADKGQVAPLIGGKHLIARGLRPGPEFKPILDAAYEAQMDGELTEGSENEWLDVHLAPRMEKSLTPPTSRALLYRPGDRVAYRHPNYPNLIRKGVVKQSGASGVTVTHHATGRLEMVRHEDVVQKLAGAMGKSDKESLGDESALVLLKGNGGGMSLAGVARKRPSAGAKESPGAPQKTSRGAQLPEWTPRVQRVPYAKNDVVMYMRPDMTELEVGEIVMHPGRHGVHVRNQHGIVHRVRWQHIHGPGKKGHAEEEGSGLVEQLRASGVPMDDTAGLITGTKPRADKALLEKLALLADAGAPIDMAQAKNAPDMAVRRLLRRLTTTDDGSQR